MNDEECMTHEDQLRAWARGMDPLAAATELLIRAGFAQEWRPWVRWDDDGSRYWVDFEHIPDLIGGMSGGEQRLLMIAASIGDRSGSATISLENELPGIDRDRFELVLAAVAHAGGFHTPGRQIEFIDGTPRFVDVPALLAWPPGGPETKPGM